jgi:PAS domain S-box-containing protein
MGPITWVSDNMSRLTGFSADAFLGDPAFWLERIHPDDRERVRREHATVVRTGTASSELRWRCADESYRWFLIHSAVTIDDDPDGPYLLGTCLDVTERKHMEEALQQNAARLGVQEQIDRQGRLAAIGQLAAGIAHDFNNILSVVIAVADRLEVDPSIDGRLKELLRLVAQQGRRGSHLVRQILDFSRRSSSAEREQLDLVPFLAQVGRLLMSTIPEHVVIETVIPAGSYLVYASPAQLQEVITNLAVNARDAMPNGGRLHIDLSTVQLEPGMAPPVTGMEAGKWIVLTMADSGMGMPPDVLQHAFEPFFTTKEAGTGLGLALVYGLIKQHDGFIAVSSDVGRGTTFRIYLPALRVTPEAGTLSVGDTDAPHGRGETILLVEDDRGVREVESRILCDYGYRVLAAESATQALQLFAERRDEVVLLLTDLVMPEMDGMNLCRLVRRQNPATRAIILSGYPAGTLTQDAAMVDATWLRKPVDPRELARAIRQALDRPSPTSARQ